MQIPFLRNLLASGTPMPNGPSAPDVPPAAPNINAPQPQQQAQNYDPSQDIIQSILDQPGQQPRFQESKGHKLLRILESGLKGGLEGYAENAQAYAQTGRNAGFGGGFAGAMEFPLRQMLLRQQVQRGGLENAVLANQVQYAPLLQKLGILKTTADVQKTQAEANAIPIKSQLQQAQTLAARYKDDPNLGLIDLQTGQPVNQQGFAPLSADEATILGKQEGDRVPLKVKNTANEISQRGIRSVQANGRSLLVDSSGRTVADMGAATPLVVMDRQLSPGTVTPEMQSKIDLVGQGKMDLPTALRTYIRYPGMADAFTAALYQKYPDFNQATYGVSKDTLKYFTTGAGASQLTAFRTAIAHADLLQQAAQALNNRDNRTFNSIVNRLQSEFGDPRLTTFNAIANAYTHEVNSVVAKGHTTDKEVSTAGATMPSSANFQTIQSVTDAYKQLMASKAQNLMIQYEQGRQGQPAFPQTGNGAPPAGARVRDYSQLR